MRNHQTTCRNALDHQLQSGGNRPAAADERSDKEKGAHRDRERTMHQKKERLVFFSAAVLIATMQPRRPAKAEGRSAQGAEEGRPPAKRRRSRPSNDEDEASRRLRRARRGRRRSTTTTISTGRRRGKEAPRAAKPAAGRGSCGSAGEEAGRGACTLKARVSISEDAPAVVPARRLTPEAKARVNEMVKKGMSLADALKAAAAWKRSSRR